MSLGADLRQSRLLRKSSGCKEGTMAFPAPPSLPPARRGWHLASSEDGPFCLNQQSRDWEEVPNPSFNPEINLRLEPRLGASSWFLLCWFRWNRSTRSSYIHFDSARKGRRSRGCEQTCLAVTDCPQRCPDCPHPVVWSTCRFKKVWYTASPKPCWLSIYCIIWLCLVLVTLNARLYNEQNQGVQSLLECSTLYRTQGKSHGFSNKNSLCIEK